MIHYPSCPTLPLTLPIPSHYLSPHISPSFQNYRKKYNPPESLGAIPSTDLHSPQSVTSSISFGCIEDEDLDLDEDEEEEEEEQYEVRVKFNMVEIFKKGDILFVAIYWIF